MTNLNEVKTFEVFLSPSCPYEWRAVKGIVFSKHVVVHNGYCKKCDIMTQPSHLGSDTCTACGTSLEYERDAKTHQVYSRVEMTYRKVAEICLKAKEKFIKKRIYDPDTDKFLRTEQVPIFNWINIQEIEVSGNGAITRTILVDKHKIAKEEAERVEQELKTIEEQKKLQEQLKVQERDKIAVLEARIKDIEAKDKSKREEELEKKVAELEGLLDKKTAPAKTGKGSKQ